MKKLLTWTAVVLAVAFTTSTAMAQRAYGIDVYEGNGSINWTSVNNAGAHFAWAKATEGTYYKDANFWGNMNSGKNAGVIMGAYDYVRPDLDSPSAEASYFYNVAGPWITTRLSAAPALDLEVFNGVVGASSYTAWCNAWFNSVKSYVSAKGFKIFNPVIYISACNACELSGSGGGFPWIASYNGENSETGSPWNVCTSCEHWGSNGWDVWQFTDTAHVSGVSGYCDEDVFHGSNLAGSYLQIQ
ncbi:MAG TPA: glycoside hydrolase family 25 protein [Verrucomicrobiae bacterium]|nr:glycoside hydrolase family 25 protein [Verrucomicrobiae bacterium]